MPKEGVMIFTDILGIIYLIFIDDGIIWPSRWVCRASKNGCQIQIAWSKRTLMLQLWMLSVTTQDVTYEYIAKVKTTWSCISPINELQLQTMIQIGSSSSFMYIYFKLSIKATKYKCNCLLPYKWGPRLFGNEYQFASGPALA